MPLWKIAKAMGRAMAEHMNDGKAAKTTNDGENDEFDEEAPDMNLEALIKEFEQALLDVLKKHGAKSDCPDIAETETERFVED